MQPGVVVTAQPAPKVDSVGAEECGFASFCCGCWGNELTMFMPHTFAECWGYVGSTYLGLCCARVNSAMCICPGHPAFAGLADNRDDVLCIWYQESTNIVKPHFLDGREPCLKSSAKSWCFTSRCACPLDDDVPGRCSCQFLSICPGIYCGCAEASGCCPKIPPLSERAFGSFELNATRGNPDQVSYMCCACPGITGCWNVSLFIPEFSKDALGMECQDTFCCLEHSYLHHLLPEKEGYEYEEILLESSTSYKCVRPSVCCQTKDRYGLVKYNSAFPCNNGDAPLAMACCGVVCCGLNNNYKQCYLGCKMRPRSDFNKDEYSGVEMQQPVTAAVVGEPVSYGGGTLTQRVNTNQPEQTLGDSEKATPAPSAPPPKAAEASSSWF